MSPPPAAGSGHCACCTAALGRGPRYILDFRSCGSCVEHYAASESPAPLQLPYARRLQQRSRHAGTWSRMRTLLIARLQLQVAMCDAEAARGQVSVVRHQLVAGPIPAAKPSQAQQTGAMCTLANVQVITLRMALMQSRSTCVTCASARTTKTSSESSTASCARVAITRCHHGT